MKKAGAEMGVLAVSCNGIVLSCDGAAAKLLGHEPDSIIGRPHDAIVPPEEFEATRALHRRAAAGEQVAAIPSARISRGGHVVRVAVDLWPITHPDGGVMCVIEQLRGTEDSDSEAVDLEDQFRIVVEASPSGLCVVDANGRIGMVNHAIEVLFGYTREELVGTPVDRLVPLKDRQSHAAMRRSYGAHPEARPMGAGRDLFALRKDGTEIAVEIGLCPLRFRGTESVLASIVDVTARKEAEERFRLVVEASPSGLCVVDEQGHIILVNRAIEQLFGYARHEIIGMSVDGLLPHSSRGAHASSRRAFAANPTARPMGAGRDLFGLRKDGTEVSVEIGLCPLMFRGKRAVLASVVDITDRRRHQDQLARYAAKLEHSNAELEKFAYVVSHDLKAPLRGIASVAQWLSEDFGAVVDDDARENISLMIERTGRLSRLIDGILQYSRAGRESGTKGSVNTDAVVSDVIASIAGPASPAIHVSRPLPPVQYNETQLRQVFQNLIDNAIKHLGKPNGTISVSHRDGDGAWEFSVRDNGVGIPQRHFERIFELFQTLRPKDESGSTGAGLAIVKRIVESNGGKVSVDSRVGEWTEFVFTVPKAVQRDPLGSPGCEARGT